MTHSEEKTLDYWINLAREIAIKAHNGQFRSDGKTPYITHVEGVANAVEKRLKPIAWLHDVVEDTNVTLDDLRNYGFPEYIIVGVDLITHRKSVPNIVYWNAIAKNADASEVKIKDIKYNTNDAPSERQKEKYARALQVFAAAGYSV